MIDGLGILTCLPQWSPSYYHGATPRYPTYQQSIFNLRGNNLGCIKFTVAGPNFVAQFLNLVDKTKTRKATVQYQCSLPLKPLRFPVIWRAYFPPVRCHIQPR